MLNEKLVAAAGLGAVTGLRTMTGLAMVSREWSHRRVPPHAGLLREWLSRDMVANTLTALALGELVADKLPGVPARIEPGPLFGRSLVGGLLGALVAGDESRAAGALAGALGAVIGAFAGWSLRREAGRVSFLPDPLIALAEDTLAVTTAFELTQDL